MTAIAAVTDGRRVWIGGDSAGVAGLSLIQRADEKVWTDKGMVFGFSGSFRMGQLLRYALTVPPRTEGDDVARWMTTSFIDSVRRTMKEGGLATVDKGVEELPGSFLLGYQGRIYNIDIDLQVGYAIHGFDAIGSGADVALGALAVAKGEPRARVLRSLQTAEMFNAGVRGPFIVRSGGKA